MTWVFSYYNSKTPAQNVTSNKTYEFPTKVTGASELMRMNLIQEVQTIRVTLKFLEYMYVCFAALRPKSTAMVIAGRSVHLTTLFPGQA